jgi:hypothetical protein
MNSFLANAPLFPPALTMSGNIYEIDLARQLAAETGQNVIVKQLMPFNGMQRTQWARPDGSIFNICEKFD